MASVMTGPAGQAVPEPGPARSGQSSIWTAGLAKSYGPTVALAGLDLHVAAGQTVALLGPNGAGKSTTIGLLLGLLSPDCGEVRVYGRSPSQAVADGLIGAMLQDAGLMPGVRVGELLTMVRGLYPRPLPLDELVGLADLGALTGRRRNVRTAAPGRRSGRAGWRCRPNLRPRASAAWAAQHHLAVRGGVGDCLQFPQGVSAAQLVACPM
jgi:ABC-type Fe3+/spermidine/putrescine transport system ATPase subunit